MIFIGFLDRALDVLGLFFALKAVWIFKDPPMDAYTLKPTRMQRLKRAIW